MSSDPAAAVAAVGYREREVVLQEGTDDGIQARFVPETCQAVLYLIRHDFGSGGLR